MVFINQYVNLKKKKISVKKYKMEAEYCRVQRKKISEFVRGKKF